MKNIHILVSLIFLPIVTRCADTTSTAIIVMGASCSGKSTVSKRLSKSLGTQWKLVELDVIEDERKALGQDTEDNDLLQAVVAQSNTLLAAGYNVIIDTNIYHDLLRTIAADNKQFILIYCPLNILLERNAKRDVVLQRTAHRSLQARKYVEKTFGNFEHCDIFDVRIDSSQKDIEGVMMDIASLCQNLKDCPL